MSSVTTIYSEADDESRRMRRDKRLSLEVKCRIEVAVAVVGEADSARVEKIPLPGRKTGDVKHLILVSHTLEGVMSVDEEGVEERHGAVGMVLRLEGKMRHLAIPAGRGRLKLHLKLRNPVSNHRL